MTQPLRKFLLNRQIAIEARRIAHTHTRTCHYEYQPGSDNDDEHTKNCNTLKREIELLAMQVKLAGVQRQRARTEQDRERRDLLTNNIRGPQ